MLHFLLARQEGFMKLLAKGVVINLNDYKRLKMKQVKSDSLKFKCPKCGSSYFGVNCEDNTINCHGEISNCNFQGSMEDDWKYFIRVEKIITTFESKQEYNSFRAIK
jgi:hypothetical protein